MWNIGCLRDSNHLPISYLIVVTTYFCTSQRNVCCEFGVSTVLHLQFKFWVCCVDIIKAQTGSPLRKHKSIPLDWQNALVNQNKLSTNSSESTLPICWVLNFRLTIGKRYHKKDHANVLPYSTEYKPEGPFVLSWSFCYPKIIKKSITTFRRSFFWNQGIRTKKNHRRDFLLFLSTFWCLL